MRQTIDLGGHWRFLPDLDPDYHDNDQYAAPDWDRRHWELGRVPGCWNSYGERYALFEGVVWFARSLHLPAWTPQAVGVLRFGGVNYEARVYVNGQRAGEHQGGYTEFTLDVSHLLHAGENWLVVRVDNRRHRILLPACLGWFNYGGLHRAVTLEVTPGARLEWVGVSAVPHEGDATGHIAVEIRDVAGAPLVLLAAIRDPDGSVVWQHARSLAGETRIEIPFTLGSALTWWPSRPALYELMVALTQRDTLVDRVRAAFGVRRIHTDGHTLLLNREPLWLRGLCHIGDHPASGIAFDATAMAGDLRDLQELGVNALRFHVPPHQAFLDECDRRGILICTETPVYCLAPADVQPSPFSDPAYRSLANGMLREMIRAHYNHPSIILWSLGNECQVAHPEAFPFFRELAQTARALDDSRLLTYASLYGEMGDVGDLVDVIGVNEYWGWYDRVRNNSAQDQPLPTEITTEPDGTRRIRVSPLDMSRLRQELEAKAVRYGKPLVLTEFGADAIPGYRAADLALWSEDYQAYFLERTLTTLRDAPGVAGAFPFLYQDYPDPSKYTNRYWDGMNYKGIVSYDRTRKLAFATLQEIYRK